MIPFGPFQPDVAGINTKVCREARNVLPAAVGFRPLKGPVTKANALNSRCLGAAVIVKDDGSITQFAGTTTKLYQLASGALTWTDVTRGAGPYATGSGERWRFASFGPTVIATNYVDVVQKFDVTVDTQFSALAGTPPKARYVDVVRDFVFLGGVNGNEKRVHWSGLNNSAFWTPGSQSCDFQDAPSGGPVKGVIGGATAYVFQLARVTRFTYVPGSTTIFQVDEVQGAKGLAASNSLVKIGDLAYYFATDGFYMFDINSGGQKPIGVNKWRSWFLDDMRAGTEAEILGAADPVNPIVLWAYISRDNSSSIPDRLLIYDRVLDEATFADITVEALASWISADVTLDTMNSYGNMETLPYTLDSPIWKGGASLLGLFDASHTLNHLQGSNMAVTLTTADGQKNQRVLLIGTRPAVDASGVTVALAMRERDADAVTFNAAEAMEDTGTCPAWASGNLGRAKIQIPAAQAWTLAKGIETMIKGRGRR